MKIEKEMSVHQYKTEIVSRHMKHRFVNPSSEFHGLFYKYGLAFVYITTSRGRITFLKHLKKV